MDTEGRDYEGPELIVQSSEIMGKLKESMIDHTEEFQSYLTRTVTLQMQLTLLTVLGQSFPMSGLPSSSAVN